MFIAPKAAKRRLLDRDSTAATVASGTRLRARVRNLPALSLALSVSVVACALEPREGDGLVSDGREIVVNPTVVVDAGRPGVAMVQFKECKHLPLFEQHVAPLFAVKYPPLPGNGQEPSDAPISCLECHDGTKPKAFAGLPMSRDKAAIDIDCQITLVLGAMKDDPLQAELLTSSDPSRQDVVHDFKFKTGEEYARFRDSVLIWLKAEKM